MEIFDNINKRLYDDLKIEIKEDSKISLASAYFSIFAYQELKKELEKIDEFRFIFTAPTFIEERTEKKSREFYIPRMSREKGIYGTEFEVKLRNELTQKSIAKECADWIREKAVFKSNLTHGIMGGFLTVENKEDKFSYAPIQGFTLADIGLERGNNIYNIVQKNESPMSNVYLNMFEEIWRDEEKLEDVTEIVIDNITAAYQENSPDLIYFFTLYNIFNEFLEDLSEDNLPNELTGFKDSTIWKMLYNFQQDAVLSIINKLEQYNGCILADSVGLGKTFTALAVIKYYENRNKSVLVLCPKKLSENWNTYRSNYINNQLSSDRLRYDVLFHTDLSRQKGESNGINLEMINWGNYDLVVIDESHNFRNGGQLYGDEGSKKENRYLRLLNKVIRQGVKTKVLMLSATPVNNKFIDLKNQIALSYEGESHKLQSKLNIDKSIDEIFKSAQKSFNYWSDLEPEYRTTKRLLGMLDFDFFEILDSVTIARSRKHIERYYDTTDIGNFPERLKPISIRESLTNLKGAVNYNDIYDILTSLNLAIYTPSSYILPSCMDKYENKTGIKAENLTQLGRERGIQKLMSINLLKRLESSVHSFKLTLTKVKNYIDSTMEIIENFDGHVSLDLTEISSEDEYDYDDQNTEYFSVGRKIQIDLEDMDYKSWYRELKQDADYLEVLVEMINDIEPQYDNKLKRLFKLIDEKIENPINDDNKKLLIFTAFSDTAEYLYEQIAPYVLEKHGLNSAIITGSVDGKTTIKGFRTDMNRVLTCFSPLSKARSTILPNEVRDIDILIATDCISEGQNLQDCDYLINYDIHWNPVRIIQRFGRIDRIGSRNTHVQLVNFWPDMDLDEYINLKSRVEMKMKISVMTSTGDDDLINQEEKGDLEYRKAQLLRLQKEVVDLEDMNSGISIMDLGLNDFRLDLLSYLDKYKEPDNIPMGIHSVISSNDDLESGVIFVLKNINDNINVNRQNRLHPFYMVYVSELGDILINHLEPKEMLDNIRHICRNKKDIDKIASDKFNNETRDGKKMEAYSELLSLTIDSIIDLKEESELDSFIGGQTMSFLADKINGLDDFELISFLVIK